jgi:tetratricopeptide (TPR) repeat protein
VSINKGLSIVISAALMLLALTACQPVLPATMAVESEPPVIGEQMGAVGSLPDYEISQTTLGELERLHRRLIMSQWLDPDLKSVIALAPNDAYDYFIRGVARAYGDELEMALQDFDTAIQLDPNLAPAYFNRGMAYALLGNGDNAVKDLEASLRLAPDASYVSEVRALLADLDSQ